MTKSQRDFESSVVSQTTIFYVSRDIGKRGTPSYWWIYKTELLKAKALLCLNVCLSRGTLRKVQIIDRRLVFIFYGDAKFL